MFYLLIASIVWAPSFGLIKYNLAGLDSSFITWMRLLISFLVFVPLLRFRGMNRVLSVNLVALGAVQYGLMYLCYIHSFKYLPAHLVALFTIFTPIYVTVINDIWKKRFHRAFFLAALLAVAGTGVIVYSGTPGQVRGAVAGFALVQVSNLCFAFGQIHYRRLMGEGRGVKDCEVFALLYLGAVAVSTLPAGLATDWFHVDLSRRQLVTLLYLGMIPSGLCFFLWNIGATRTNAGALAVFNNVKIPLAILCSLLVFGEQTDVKRLAIGGAVIVLALFIGNANRKRNGPSDLKSPTDC